MSLKTKNIIQFRENPKYPETRQQPTYQEMIEVAKTVKEDTVVDLMQTCIRRIQYAGQSVEKDDYTQLVFETTNGPYDLFAFELSKVTNYILHVINHEPKMNHNDEYLINNGEIFEMDGSPQTQCNK